MDLAKQPDPTALRDAATTILLRDDAVLMGQRGANAAFLPGKFVFPGGAVDPVDHDVSVAGLTDQLTASLSEESQIAPSAVVAAAVRELWEETGQILGTPAQWNDAPKGWRGFAASGHVPNGAACEYFFRAVTPVGRPRRFDARFILANASDLITDPDDFSNAEDELAHLQWVPLKDARQFDLPFITQVVLAELRAYIARGHVIAPPPFFRNDDERHLVTRLGGASPLD